MFHAIDYGSLNVVKVLVEQCGVDPHFIHSVSTADSCVL
jgi:hypothetical protein